MFLLFIFLFTSFYAHANSKFTILSWNKNKYFNNNSNCTALNCEIIFNRSKLNYVNAILFDEHYFSRKYKSKIYFPIRSNSKILNVYTSIDSSIPTKKNGFKRNYKLPLNYFNLIFSYNSKSDIVFTVNGPWVIDENLKNETFHLSYRQDDIFKIKSVPIVWINKDCTLTEGQEKVISNLQSKIKLEQFQRCGEESIDVTEKTIKNLYEKYYFYIVMDEMDCQDYLTISYWEAATFNVIPIVTVRRIYQHLLPPSSFIAMDDYKNADEMVFYLKFLIENKPIYSRYFNYRKKGWTIENKPKDYNICNLCKKLIEFKIKGSYTKFKNIQTWTTRNTKCLKKNYISQYWKILH